MVPKKDEKKDDESKPVENEPKPGERPVEPEPKAEILDAEDVEAAQEAVAEATDRAEASEGEQAPEVVALLGKMETRLASLEEKLASGQEITADDLTEKDRAAVALGRRSVAKQFLQYLDACLSGVLRIPGVLSSEDQAKSD